MRDFADNGIVLKVSDYRDDDRLCEVLTAEHGVCTVLFRGVKKQKAKLKAFAQIFTVFNARFVSRSGAFLTVIEPMLISDGFTIGADLQKLTACSVAAEVTCQATLDVQPHPQLFAEILKLIKSAEFDGDPYYQAAVYIAELLKICGFYKEYPFSDDPKTPVQLLGYAQRYGHIKRENSDLGRRALKFICSEFSRFFDVGLKSVQSIDLYA